jgi:hypothetical protein
MALPILATMLQLSLVSTALKIKHAPGEFSDRDIPVIYHTLRHPTWLERKQWVEQLRSHDNLHSKIVNQKEGKSADDFTTRALEHGTLSAAQSNAILGAAQSAVKMRYLHFGT